MSRYVVEHEDSVRPEWIDSNGHMNLACYVVAFDLATDRLYDALGIGNAYRTGHRQLLLHRGNPHAVRTRDAAGRAPARAHAGCWAWTASGCTISTRCSTGKPASAPRRRNCWPCISTCVSGALRRSRTSGWRRCGRRCATMRRRNCRKAQAGKSACRVSRPAEVPLLIGNARGEVVPVQARQRAHPSPIPLPQQEGEFLTASVFSRAWPPARSRAAPGRCRSAAGGRCAARDPASAPATG